MHNNFAATGLAVLLLLAGCASSGTMVTEQQAGQFQDGVTTRAQVIAKLGQPNQATLSSDGTRIDIYVHVTASADGATFIPVVGLLAGGANSKTNTATFTFDKEGLLKTVATSTGQARVNTGLLNQK
jgi:outer membrane protein assembly factor BamE (lipoprotein component of BamABCDE complex)